VSLASQVYGLERLANLLFALNVAAWCVLWVLNVLRVVLHPRRFFGDMVDHLHGPGFFTMVAGTAVLGSQFAIMAADFRLALALWAISVVLWLALIYTIFTAFTVKQSKPTLDRGINGAWLLAVVATQSIAVLSALIAAHGGPAWRFELNFLALAMWLWGGMLYIWIISLIFYRYTFFALQPSDLNPPYWINMGAMAISTLAGSLLIVNAAEAPLLHSLLPFLKGFTIFYWATGTWWIPMLLALGVWRYVWQRFPLRYNPLYWGAVFPLGMYCASTNEMALALDFALLHRVAQVFLYVAIAAWAAAFAGLVRQIAGRLLQKEPREAAPAR
ncbi:MAG: tellurite resistance/C4-dicarboxylate transporter family protein, partial [Gammaproteobacteria bacterium]